MYEVCVYDSGFLCSCLAHMPLPWFLASVNRIIPLCLWELWQDTKWI